MWGRPTHVVQAVTRQVEPEWDADSRALAEALFAHDAAVCPGCGIHQSILDDPENNVFTIDQKTCEVCAAIARHGRSTSARDADFERRQKDPGRDDPLAAHLQAAGVRRPGDGRHVYLRSRDEAATGPSPKEG